MGRVEAAIEAAEYTLRREIDVYRELKSDVRTYRTLILASGSFYLALLSFLMKAISPPLPAMLPVAAVAALNVLAYITDLTRAQSLILKIEYKLRVEKMNPDPKRKVKID